MEERSGDGLSAGAADIALLDKFQTGHHPPEDWWPVLFCHEEIGHIGPISPIASSRKDDHHAVRHQNTSSRSR